MSADRITVYKLTPTSERPNYKLEWVEPGTTRRRSKTAGTSNEKEAERLRAELEYELNHGKYQASKMSWEDFREEFLSLYVAGLRARTVEKYNSVLDSFEEIIKPARVSSITENTIAQFVRGMRERRVSKDKVGMAPQSIKNYLVALKKALRWALEQKIIAALPAFPKIKISKKRPQPVSKHEFAALVNHCPDYRWKAFLCCAWYCGLRLTEASSLRRQPSTKKPWVDFARERIVLPAEFAKSDEDQWVPLHPIVKTLLAKVPDDGNQFFRFVSKKTHKPLTRSGLSSNVIYFASLAGVKLSMHRLRKGFGCRVAQQLGKGNAPILHRLMRHSSMQITMDYYASVDDVLNDAIKGLK